MAQQNDLPKFYLSAAIFQPFTVASIFTELADSKVTFGKRIFFMYTPNHTSQF